MYLLGVEHVTVYAFAIDNFKRGPEEVDALMKLAEERLLEFCEQGCVFYLLILRVFLNTDGPFLRGVLRKYGVRLVAVGKVDLCPPGVREAIRRAEELTKDNTKCAPTMPPLCLILIMRLACAQSSVQPVHILLVARRDRDRRRGDREREAAQPVPNVRPSRFAS
jgi:hypothetical protein